MLNELLNQVKNYKELLLKGLQEIDGKSIPYEIYDLEEKIKMIKKIIPIEYHIIDLKEIRPDILSFYESDNIFMWIYGKVGRGKTYSINGLRMKKISEGWQDFEIIKECNLSYKDIDKYKNEFFCIDDFGLSENDKRNISLLDLYYELIDNKREYHSKLIITSNYSINEWLNKMKKYNYETALRITSRFSKKIEVIQLTGGDRRQNAI